MNNEFILILDKHAKAEWKKIVEKLEGLDSHITVLHFEVLIEKEILKDFGLNEDLRFIVENNIGRTSPMKYYYKNLPVEPECYYMKPQNYIEVDTLTILRACVDQNTNLPNIKPFEDGSVEIYKNNTNI